MSIQIRKKENGRLEARILSKDKVVLLNKTFRENAGERIDITHIWLPTQNTWVWIISNLVMEMLNSENNQDDNEIYYSDEERNIKEVKRQLVHFPGTTILASPFIHGDPIYLLDTNGAVLAGSNIHTAGNLCLGDSFSPTGMAPVELLIYNKANKDLSFYGEPISGEYKARKDTTRTKIFKINEWTPASHKPLQLEALDLLAPFLS